ncbi:hypothetical protein FH972_017476 [Carpinus fangiana]|uniref:Uncharacterized protein n=1 Tax=Carpinus fangiana TaxID=176857 RepID=A0A5N6RMG4_9ROSI|nr:hypothetical protein FH972_017476 [Carpinus fangiana]
MDDVEDSSAERGQKPSGQKRTLANELTELANKEGQQDGAAEENLNEEGWRKRAKRSRASSNKFFTLIDVEQKMQRAISHETGGVCRASDDTWRKKDQTNKQ